MIRKIWILLLIVVSSFKSDAQIIFESGYFITDADERVDCLIRNMDWINNPSKFQYKLSSNDAIKVGDIHTVKEFGINQVSKYIRTQTKIDRSSDRIEEMDAERNPVFQEELLFLKVLIEGQFSLLQYVDNGLVRFFYKTKDSTVNQLVFKRYMVDDKVLNNDYFKQQLLILFNSEKIALEDFTRLKYDDRDLEKLFIKYYEVNNLTFINYQPKRSKYLFHLTIRPGINYSSLEIESAINDLLNTNFGSSLGFRLGAEAEFILPFNKNKWGVVIEPTYQHVKSEEFKQTNQVSGGVLISKFDYKAIGIPVGIRHYFFLNQKSKLFLNVNYVFDFGLNSTIKFLRNDNSVYSSFDIKSISSLAMGIGYKFKNTLGIEMRYQPSPNILSEYPYMTSNYNTLLLTLGYSLFK
ncbi:outer membrane beta-barrel protein [Pedobacter glucosidilyticus]|uniref:outer membrane beta-barrel protein n=1 Tax=Pedobacter glucosidilyticus TaxID=1122941 RepID=UPI000403C7C1|nr:outer membrane beta-barrel protein [Pedobacter glucosidilyticus]